MEENGNKGGDGPDRHDLQTEIAISGDRLIPHQEHKEPEEGMDPDGNAEESEVQVVGCLRGLAEHGDVLGSGLFRTVLRANAVSGTVEEERRIHNLRGGGLVSQTAHNTVKVSSTSNGG